MEEYTLLLEHFTDGAIFVSIGTHKEWVPRSLVIINDKLIKGSHIRVEMPDWLAEEKGFA